MGGKQEVSVVGCAGSPCCYGNNMTEQSDVAEASAPAHVQGPGTHTVTQIHNHGRKMLIL